MCFLTWEIVSRTVSAQLANGEPESALRWQGDNSNALVALAERSAGEPQPDLAEIRRLAVLALRANPLSERALVDLAAVSEAEGDTATAGALMRAAGARDPRDPKAQGWLVNDALKTSNFNAALPHLDTLMRTHPEAAPRLLPPIVQTAQFLKAASSLAELMQADPPWRRTFMDVLASKAPLPAISRFYAILQAGPRPTTDAETKPYIDRLLREAKFKEAYALWEAHLPADRRPGDTLLYNGAFRLPLDDSAFNWRLVQSLGSNIEISPDGGDNAVSKLSVDFSGSRVDFANVSHLLVLPPGSYELRGDDEAVNLHAERGVWWRIACLSLAGTTLGQTSLFATSGPWKPFSLIFEIPALGCQAQKLLLELPARTSLDRVISGTLSFRNLQIVRTAARPTASSVSP